ncbi:MAG: S41 family peptidase [Draconibacterium sp.]
MNRLFVIVTLFLTVSCYGQVRPKLNLGFEETQGMNSIPDGWFKWGSFDITSDTISREGTYSVKISSNRKPSEFGCCAYKLPVDFKANSITLEGFMKIENVSDGQAGLLLRIDGKGTTLAFDNMQQKKIDGTKDWKYYSTTLKFPDGAETIYIGGILSGKGTVWFDRFQLIVDGKDFHYVEPVEKQVLNADLDKEFDSGSGLLLANLNRQQVKNLALLGKIWGFLKYYHPEIAKGNYNWDYELFRFLPVYNKANTIEQRNELLVNWINSLGDIPKIKETQAQQETVLKPDFSWMEDLSPELQGILQNIYDNRKEMDGHYYYRLTPNVGNPVFTNENAYSAMSYPDDGFRLLTLFRYWNTIEYFFPYRHLIDKNWDKVLEEYIPVFISANNELEFEKAAIRIIADVKDTHANLWGGANKINEQKGTLLPPIRVGFAEDKLVVTDFYNEEHKSTIGLKIGDVITHINGKSVGAIIDSLSMYYPASNQPTKLRNIAADILRSADKQIEITLLSEGSRKDMDLVLYPASGLNYYGLYKKPEGPCFKILEGNIGYVFLGTIKNEDIERVKVELKDTKGIIIDIRNYPSAFVPFALGAFFCSEQKPFVKFSKVNWLTPGEFTFTPALNIPASTVPYKGKLMVLVNEVSQSQAEYTAMAFRAGDNTTIIGSTTAGADGNVSSIMLPGGLRTMISGIGVYYPDGTETQRVGIIPDIEVKPTIKGIKEGRDELLEKAVELINAL